MKDLFSHLGFAVDVKENLTSDDMKSLIFDYARKNHSSSSAAVCVIMSHGRGGLVCGTGHTEEEEDTVAVTEIANILHHHCDTLRGKPKMFFVQACQSGKSEWSGARVVSLGGQGSGW